jgi:hypothetical protein
MMSSRTCMSKRELRLRAAERSYAPYGFAICMAHKISPHSGAYSMLFVGMTLFFSCYWKYLHLGLILRHIFY